MRRWFGGETDSVVQAIYERRWRDLPTRERLHAEALDSDTNSRSIQLLARLTAEYPDYWPGWMDYGDVLLHNGPMLGRPVVDAVRPFERALELNHALEPVRAHLSTLYLQIGDVDGARRLTAFEDYAPVISEWMALRETPPATWTDSWVDRFEEEPVADRARIATYATTWEQPRSQLELNARLHARFGDPVVWWGDAVAHAQKGNWDAALSAAEQYLARDSTYAPLDAYRLAVFGAWLGGLSVAQAAAVRPAGPRPDLVGGVTFAGNEADARAELAWLDGVVALLQGRGDDVRAARARIRADSAQFGDYLDGSLAALADASNGEAAAATSLAALEWEVADRNGLRVLVFPPIAVLVDRFTAADAALADGRIEDALRLARVQEIGSRWYFDELPIALSHPQWHLLRARIAEATQQPEEATRCYLAFLRLYEDPDPALRPLVEEAEAALRRLAAEPGEPGR